MSLLRLFKKQGVKHALSCLILSAGILGFTSVNADKKNFPTVTVVDPSPVNWLWITWNTMDEIVRVDSEGNEILDLAESYTWKNKTTLEMVLRPNIRFHDGELLTAKVFRKSFDEVQRWKNPHPPGAFLNFHPKTKLEVLGKYSVRFTFPEPDASAIMKFRGMHVGSTKFWNQLAFIDAKTKNAEGHW